MNDPAWLNLVPESFRQEYATELDELVEFAKNVVREADTKLEEAIFPAGQILAPEQFVRPFRALVIAVDACRQAEAQSDESVFLGTIGRWLRRSIPLLRTDLAELLRVVVGTRDAKQQGALLGAALGTFKRILGASPLNLAEPAPCRRSPRSLTNPSSRSRPSQSSVPTSTSSVMIQRSRVCTQTRVGRTDSRLGGRSRRRGGREVGRLSPSPGRRAS